MKLTFHSIDPNTFDLTTGRGSARRTFRAAWKDRDDPDGYPRGWVVVEIKGLRGGLPVTAEIATGLRTQREVKEAVGAELRT